MNQWIHLMSEGSLYRKNGTVIAQCGAGVFPDAVVTPAEQAAEGMNHQGQRVTCPRCFSYLQKRPVAVFGHVTVNYLKGGTPMQYHVNCDNRALMPHSTPHHYIDAGNRADVLDRAKQHALETGWNGKPVPQDVPECPPDCPDCPEGFCQEALIEEGVLR